MSWLPRDAFGCSEMELAATATSDTVFLLEKAKRKLTLILPFILPSAPFCSLEPELE